MSSVVAIAESDNKIEALDSVIERSAFLEDLRESLDKAGKNKEKFLIAVKPNIMMIYSKQNLHVGTDPELVEHLAERIREEGYQNIKLVESRNAYTDWFPKRTVKYVAQVVGYTSDGYDVIDLTDEAEPYDYGGKLGGDFVGRTWRDADYRISFQKNKTHILVPYTLTMKNMFGTAPRQSKYKTYHKKPGWKPTTIDILRNFPPDFAFIDAFWSSDGMNGCVIENLKNTRTIIGGTDFVAVDWVGALKMGLNPIRNRLMEMATDVFGMPEFEVDGNLAPYSNWKNASMVMGNIMRVVEFLGIASLLYHLIFMFLMDKEFK